MRRFGIFMTSAGIGALAAKIVGDQIDRGDIPRNPFLEAQKLVGAANALTAALEHGGQRRVSDEGNEQGNAELLVHYQDTLAQLIRCLLATKIRLPKPQTSANHQESEA